MKTLVAFVVFIVSFKEIDLHPYWPSTGYYYPYYGHPYQNNPYPNSGYEYSSGSSGSQCPVISEITHCTGSISSTCENGKLLINGKRIRNVKPTDHVAVIENKVRVNGKFVCKLPTSIAGNSVNSFQNNLYSEMSSDSSKSNSNLDSGMSRNDCPPISMIGCVNVSRQCKNGRLTVNGKKINVKLNPSDKVVIYGNDLYINNEFIYHIPIEKK